MSHAEHKKSPADSPHACCAKHAPTVATADENGAKQIDPVCGMRVAPNSPHAAEHAGRRYVFCSAGCRTKFAAAPERFVDEDGKPRAAPASHTHSAHAQHHAHAARAETSRTAPEASTATIYTCPMHPEIRQVGPGSCPICGMALEPLMPTDVEDDGELRSVRRRFWISAALAVPVVAVAMLPHVLMLHLSSGGAWLLRTIEIGLSAPVVGWAGLDYYRRGWLGIRNRSPNMYTLIGLGVIVACLFSFAATFAPAAFPAQMRDAHGMVGVYFEVAAVIITLVLLGEWLELGARGRTSAAIRQLLGLAPKTARRIGRDGSEEDVPLDRGSRTCGFRDHIFRPDQ